MRPTDDRFVLVTLSVGDVTVAAERRVSARQFRRLGLHELVVGPTHLSLKAILPADPAPAECFGMWSPALTLLEHLEAGPYTQMCDLLTFSGTVRFDTDIALSLYGQWCLSPTLEILTYDFWKPSVAGATDSLGQPIDYTPRDWS